MESGLYHDSFVAHDLGMCSSTLAMLAGTHRTFIGAGKYPVAIGVNTKTEKQPLEGEILL